MAAGDGGAGATAGTATGGDRRPHVLIVGGGFGGIEAARALRRAPVRITLVDRSNHHLFQPLLYQVATAALAPSDIAEPIRSILSRQENVAVRLGEVVRVDLDAKTAVIRGLDDANDTVPFDAVIVAAGVSHSYFGQDGWARFAPGLKTLGDALEMRRRILSAFELAEWAEPEARAALTTFVVVGGGPTGVELAGAISEIAFGALKRDFRHIDPKKTRIVLVEAGPDLLPGFPPHLRERAKQQLERLRVEIRVGAKVTGVDAHGVSLGEERIASSTVLWAAGVAGEPLARTLGVPLDRAGRVPVGPDCAISGHPNAFVIGDLAVFVPDGAERPLPGVAQVAMQMGRHAGRQIARDLDGKPRETFVYADKGSLATIGRSKAVADLGWFTASGLIAWTLWAFVHILFLITFRSRIVVITKWAWAWFTYERAVRLIWRAVPLTGDDPRDTVA